ncbi:hypothetical protein ASE86_11190 [Sphingomonas sp. Leaf33]|uniref:hypothetical protein n=1 Tax=Sphingomonas sp. Leaf33 TaxID=1736215 RepID=UPI0006F767A7|nr:hypothetical protein [Sphingomonas sp. Leaf33]KQN26630.1 hypothetical protein ASE86_11190 [Sphingomonas sp. Leaf33]
MTDSKKTKPSSPPDPVKARQAKAAAQQTIGKLIGDDAAVAESRAKQSSARAKPVAGDTDKS